LYDWEKTKMSLLPHRGKIGSPTFRLYEKAVSAYPTDLLETSY
jgi:hypothetical protein